MCKCKCLNMKAEINESKIFTKNICNAIVNVNLTGENVIQTKIGITITVGVRKKVQKSIIFAKNIIFGIQQHVLVKMVNI